MRKDSFTIDWGVILLAILCCLDKLDKGVLIEALIAMPFYLIGTNQPVGKSLARFIFAVGVYFDWE